MEKNSRTPQLRESSARVLAKSSDMIKRKKVKFLDPISSRESSGRQDLPSSRKERVQSPNDGDAKTSEFKSFKRLLGETDCKRRFNRMPKHDDNLKTFEVSDCMQVKNDMGKNISETKRTLLPAQQVTPIARRSPSSARISQCFELENDGKHKDNKYSFLSPVRKVTSHCWRSCISPAETSLNCGPEHEYEGIFLKKRKKLLQLAAEASSHKVDEMLSNKSDLIQEFLQRLGTGRKSDDPDEHPKPGEKVSCAKYRMPTSLVSYGDNKNLQETVRADDQRSLRRKQEMGLLTDRCSEADEQITLPADHVNYQDLLNFHALEAGSVFHTWQSIPVSGDKRKSCLYAENKAASSIDLGWYQTARNMLSNSDELITLPQDYPMVHSFSASDVFDSGLQGIQWHSNPNLVDEGIVENKSAPTRYFAMGHTVPKMDRYICLPCDHAELQSFPTWKSLDTDLEDRKWSSNSAFKGERISNNRSISTGYHMTDRLLSKDDELITLPSDVMLQSVPARHSTQTAPQGKNKHSIPLLGGISNLRTEMEFESRKYGFHSDENMLSNYGHWIPNNFPTGDQVKNYSIVPYFDSGSSSDLSGRDLYSELAKEQCSLPILQWSGTTEPELPGHSAGEHSKRLDCLPLMLYGAQDILDTTEGLRAINACRGRNIFSAIPRYCHFSAPTSGIELDGNNLEHCWSINSKNPFDKKLEDGGFGCSVSRNTYDDFEDAKTLFETQSYFSADFPYLRHKFSVDREKSIFNLLPERLSWHWP